MNSSVLLDTSFLISLVDDNRVNHQKAKDFYKYFLEKKIAMILSSIAVAEFCIKQPFGDLPVSTFRLLAFNVTDAHHISSVFEEYFKPKPDGMVRACVKDDFKLVSQASFNNITYFITEDQQLITKIIEPLYDDLMLSTKPIYLADGVNKAFNILTNNPLFGPTLFDGEEKGK